MRCLRESRVIEFITPRTHLYINVVAVVAEGAYYCFYPHRTDYRNRKTEYV